MSTKKSNLQKFLDEKHYVLYHRDTDRIVTNYEGFPWKNIKSCLDKIGNKTSSGTSFYKLSWKVEEIQDAVPFKAAYEGITKEKSLKTRESKIEYVKSKIKEGTIIVVKTRTTTEVYLVMALDFNGSDFLCKDLATRFNVTSKRTFSYGTLVDLMAEKNTIVTFEQC
jgi:hypothetical protein